MSTKNVVESSRDVVQDLLVPELKAVKVSVDALHSEMGYLRTELRLRDERLEELIRHGDERNEKAILNLGQRIDDTIEVRERLAAIEVRLPRQ